MALQLTTQALQFALCQQRPPVFTLEMITLTLQVGQLLLLYLHVALLTLGFPELEEWENEMQILCAN